MELLESKNGSTMVLEAVGRLDASTAPDCERRLAELLKDGERFFLFDLGGLEHIDSSGLRILLMLARRLGGLEGQMVLCRLSDRVREVFEVAGFSAFFQMTASRRSAFGILPPDVSLSGLADFIATQILPSGTEAPTPFSSSGGSLLRRQRATAAVARLLRLAPEPAVRPSES